MYIFNDDSVVKSEGGEIISFETLKGGIYVLSTERDVLKEWRVLRKEFKRNTGPKKSKLGIATLGLPRMF